VAKEVFTRLIDDLDGGEAVETVTFGLDGYSYQIDLSTKNATKLRNALASYVEHGSRASGRASAGPRASARPRVAASAGREQNQAIREWAQRKGYDVAPRGRIKQDIVDQYQKTAGR
jgi:nucleoid-associated protein Lsr2